jgi:hypothetical protein
MGLLTALRKPCRQTVSQGYTEGEFILVYVLLNHLNNCCDLYNCCQVYFKFFVYVFCLRSFLLAKSICLSIYIHLCIYKSLYLIKKPIHSYGPSVAGIVVYRAGYFGLYDFSKTSFLPSLKLKEGSTYIYICLKPYLILLHLYIYRI